MFKQAFGGGVLASTLLTKAEWGVCRVPPFKAHLALDVAVSLFSLSAPWLFGFANNSKVRSTVFTIGAVGAEITSLTGSKEMPWYKSTEAHKKKLTF